jgi:hypothetical protein
MLETPIVYANIIFLFMFNRFLRKVSAFDLIFK